jgi:glutaredoxin
MAKWTIYSKNNCPYCDKAKYALKDEDVEVKNISDNPDYLTELMKRNPVARTMPQVFKGDQLVGGYDSLRALLMVTTGELSL